MIGQGRLRRPIKPRLSIGLRGQLKRFLLDSFANRTAADALNANLHGLGSATGCRGPDLLQVRSKLTTRDASDLGTDATKIFCFTSRLNRIAHLRAFTTNFTNASHDFIRSFADLLS